MIKWDLSQVCKDGLISADQSILYNSVLEKTLMLGKLEAKGEEDDRRLDGLMTSPTKGTRTWANSGR